MTANISPSKQRFTTYREALYDCDATSLPQQLEELFDSGCAVRLPFPIGDVTGGRGLFESGFEPLLMAVPDLERRDYIVAGAIDRGEAWIGCGGYYTGVFENSWLDIQPTQHLITMRYIEFYRFDGQKIVEAKLLWDIPALMMQAGMWPMGPSLGVEFNVPGPAVSSVLIRLASGISSPPLSART